VESTVKDKGFLKKDSTFLMTVKRCLFKKNNFFCMTGLQTSMNDIQWQCSYFVLQMKEAQDG